MKLAQFCVTLQALVLPELNLQVLPSQSFYKLMCLATVAVA